MRFSAPAMNQVEPQMSAHVYLLDTNILLAALLAPERLPEQVAANLADPDNTVYFSSASIWEVAS